MLRHGSMRLIIAILIFSFLAIETEGQAQETNGTDNSTQPPNATDGEADEQDSYHELHEENPGPFMIRKLPYTIVEDESEPDYFGILGISRSSKLAKMRQSFRESSRRYRDLLMNFRSIPHISRLNLTNSTKASTENKKQTTKSRTRSLPLFRSATQNSTNTTGLNSINESLAAQNAADAAAREIAKRKREEEKLRQLNDFMSRSEAYRILTNPRLDC
jgi:hypothetical protein